MNVMENKCIITFNNGKQLVVTVDDENCRTITNRLSGIEDHNSDVFEFDTVKNEHFVICCDNVMSGIVYNGINIVDKTKAKQFKIIHNISGSAEKHTAHAVTYDIYDDNLTGTVKFKSKFIIYNQLNDTIQIFVNTDRIMYLQYDN